MNTAGGITGGDVYDLELKIECHATFTLTTQAAERAYRAQPGEVGQVASKLDVQCGATMNWLPQELILFDRSALQRSLVINLETGAQLLMVEPIVFGRAAMRETLRNVTFKDRIKITRDGVPLYIDGMDLTGDAAIHLSRGAIAGGAGAMASVVLVHPNADRQLAMVRTTLPISAGASMIADDVLVVRLLAQDSFELRRSLIPLLEQLSDTPLPTSWRL